MRQQDAHSKLLFYDLARSMVFSQTGSEKTSNQLASELMAGQVQDQRIQSIYHRISEKQPHLLSKLNYLGKDREDQIQQNTIHAMDGAICDEATQVSQTSTSEMLDEVVTTQLSQVAYHLRQKKRAFDAACLLELLGKDYLQRKLCIETSRDLAKTPTDEVRPKVFGMKHNSQMIQLLLALSKDAGCEQPKSNFAKTYLQRKLRLASNQQLQVQPNPAEYKQSDCLLLERDKTMQGRRAYLTYDNTSFENGSFKKQYDGVARNSGAQPYELESLEKAKINRFNADLVNNKDKANQQHFQVGVSAAGGQQPTPLLGATLRSVHHADKVISKRPSGVGGLFGAGESSGPTGFGMTLQIPSLPPIDQNTIFNKDGSIDTNQIQPTFSFFQSGLQQSDQQAGGESAAQAARANARLTITATGNGKGSGNKRQIKKESKLDKKQKVSVWSLMPYIDESALENCVDKQSGIARLWEDQSLHLHMRNLSVTEPGVITAQKEASFRACFKESQGSVIRVPGSSKSITERELVRSLILVLQGIPSKQVFELEKTTFTFNTNPNLVISDLCCTSKSLQQLCTEFTQAGCYFLHLREFSEFMSSHKSKGAGQVVEAFALAIQDFLIFYQHQVNELENKARAHRDACQQTTDTSSKIGAAWTEKYVSLLEIKVLMAPLLAQIQTIASICFTSKFIEDIKWQQEMKKDEADSANVSFDNGQNDFKFMALLYQRNALTATNLQEQIEENLEKIRSQQWLNEFPKGARLLTYLYRIMIASEADLQVIDLLRRIFTQSARPLLRMISEFITIGSFEDPFAEFFVEKLYRGQRDLDESADVDVDDIQHDQPIDESDFIYKLTNDIEKIPVFLSSNQTAVTIFKIGCDLNLLKTKRQQIITDNMITQTENFMANITTTDSNSQVNLPDYFAICASGEQQSQSKRLAMIDSAPRQLSLDFSLQRLQEKQKNDERLFKRQADMLQAIERQIAQEETDALLQHIQLREKAAVFRMTEREKEVIKVAEAKAAKKRQFMQEIQEQIDQRRQDREAVGLAEQANREKMKRDQDEYERIQKGVAEHLKRQLMDILRQNQSIADTRTENAIQKEALENEVTELEKKAEQAKQEVISVAETSQQRTVEILATGEKGETVKENEEMKEDQKVVAPGKETGAAGRASSLRPGGLAGLVFGEGKDDEGVAKPNPEADMPMDIVEEDEIAEESGARTDFNAGATVKLDEIEFDLADDEKKLLSHDDESDSKVNPEDGEKHSTAATFHPAEDAETDEEKRAYIKKTFMEPLLNRVFAFIGEKSAMDSKRKTWNFKHQVELVEALQRKKSNWEYTSAQTVPIKARMDAIFKEFAVESGKEWKPHQEEEEVKGAASQTVAQKDMFNVPVALAIEQSIISVVEQQHKLVNKCLLHMMHRGLFLVRHLEYLKMVFLASQGDVFLSLHQNIFNDDFQQTAKDSSLQFLNQQLEHAVRSSRPERTYYNIERRNNQDQANATNVRQPRPIELGVNLTQLISEDGIELTKFKFVPSGKSNQLDLNPNFFFTISNIGDYVRLEYEVEHPLDRVISQQCMNKYNTLFFFLLKLKRVNHCLTIIWKELNGAEFRRISKAEFMELRKLQFLWQQMQYFLRTIDEYVMVAVVQSQWSILKRELAHVDYFEELIALHNAYLDTVLEKCFLARARDNRLQITLNQIFEFVFKLHFLVRSYGVEVCRDQQAKLELENISNSFRDYSRFMYQIVRNLAQKGQFKELFIRLDFNKFFQNSAGAGLQQSQLFSRPR